MKNIGNDPRSLFNGDHFSIYSVTKILRKIRATTFTENYGKLCVRGMRVLVAQLFTFSLPSRI